MLWKNQHGCRTSGALVIFFRFFRGETQSLGNFVKLARVLCVFTVSILDEDRVVSHGLN